MTFEDRGLRRKIDFKHALRKKRKSDNVLPDAGKHPWYKHLHQYSKGKIHCSCPICRSKTENNGAKEHTISDQRKFQSLSDQLSDAVSE